MLDELKQAANLTATENGAVTYASTGSDCLDLFATIGALRNAEGGEILGRFDGDVVRMPNGELWRVS